MKFQGNMTQSKEHNSFPVTDSQETASCDFPGKELQTVAFWKPSEPQENPERLFSEVRKTKHEQNKKFTREIEIIKKNQTISRDGEYNKWNVTKNCLKDN